MDRIRPNKTPYSTISGRNPWLPGLQRIPVLGTGALILSIVSLLFSAIVLALSNGKTLEEWNRAWAFTPTVYLSIASTIVNITLHYAFTIGIDIYWWRTALAPTTTIAKLHRVWSYGNSFIDSARYLTSLNLMSIACILVTLTPINGPLLQRASQVRARDFSIPRSLDLSIPSQLPVNYSAYLIGRGHSVWYTPDFSKIVRDYSNQIPLQVNSSCDDCKSTVLGAGLAVSCQSSYIPHNMSSAPIPLGNNSYNWHLAEIFQSGFTWSQSLPSVILLGAQIKTGKECAGNLLQRNCTLAAATVEYPVRVTNSTINLEPGTTIWDDVVVGQLFNASDAGQDYSGTLGTTWAGMALALQNEYGSFLIVEYDPVVQYQLFFDGAAAHTYLNQSNGYPDCNMTFTDPIDDMLASARELAFRTAINVGATNSSYMRSFAATETTTSNIYESQYQFLALAAGLSVLGILAVVVSFNGFWNMGRKISLSPIETAKAFGTPLLRSHDSNAPIESLLREVGARRVRYGVVSVGQATAVEHGNFEYPITTVKYRDRPWGATGSASIPTKRARQEPYREILADDEFEMQEPSIRSGYSASQYSQSSTMPLANARTGAEVLDDQGPALSLQISSIELVQPPTIGAQYTG